MAEVKKVKVKEEAESPSMKVGIGLSATHLLTAAQLDELRRQVVIYEYIAAGLAVPAALVLPIWKSSADFFGFAPGEIYRLCTRFGGFSRQEFDYRNMMDHEPGRCRRTDGKKWRCKKDVVPGRKYCEGHMHRSRQRSRKHVENSETVAASTSGIAGCINAAAVMITSTVHKDSIAAAKIGTNKRGSNNDHKIQGDDDINGNCSNSVSFEKLIDSSNTNRNIRNVQGAASQGLNFSPKSVLQVQGCRAARFCRRDTELEPHRCRRTDGKKWRCRREVFPNEKYCKMHMDRGAKKRTEASQSPARLHSRQDTSTSASQHSTAILPNKGDGANLNTNLSVAISANPQLITIDYTSQTTICDSTISDTIVVSCEDGNFSS